jgi:ubiquinone/menaquinone biosynthesis C-methylase UbiE
LLIYDRFLLDTFGEVALRGGSGVLDVAGGKGELSFEFVNLHGMRSTVLDPRPLHLTKFEKYLRVRRG